MSSPNSLSEATDLSDTVLVALGKAGDAHAIEHLVRRYWHEAYIVARRIVHTHEDAEEVAQDALWAAGKHLSAFREDACFRTWLHRITINHSLMALRRKHSPLAATVAISEELLPRSVEGPPTPEELLLELERSTVVREELSRLPDYYSFVIRSASEGRSGNEIAGQLGISESTVKTRLRRGRARLRRQISDRLRFRGLLRLRAAKPDKRFCRVPSAAHAESICPQRAA
jgi:RNA polymerase sigma-70 factor (ECF subfamily)